jgi:hypothetical protein
VIILGCIISALVVLDGSARSGVQDEAMNKETDPLAIDLLVRDGVGREFGAVTPACDACRPPIPADQVEGSAVSMIAT